MSQSRLRKRPSVNYLDDLRLPRVRRAKIKAASPDRLYPLRVVDEDEVRQLVKVHYEGYSTSYDEWRAKDDIVDLHSGDETGHGDGDTFSEDTLDACSLISPFNLYRELVVGIKASLTSGRKKSPQIRLRMPFDRLIFDGGLKARAVEAGGGKYTIKQYQDLQDILGEGWYYRGLNEHGDFCFVILQSIRFHLYQRRPIADYQPLKEGDEVCTKAVHHPGYMLAFDFVRGDGTREDFHHHNHGAFLPPDD